MASKLRQTVLKCILESVSTRDLCQELGTRLKISTASENTFKGILHFNKKQNEERPSGLEEIIRNEKKIIEAGASRLINFTQIYHGGGSLEFEFSANDFMKDVLTSNPLEIDITPNKKKVIVEFSSPNIAKQFHVGHLRSTMVGNFISNVKKKVGNEVLRLNYLGDWGTQFGLLIIGIKLLGYTEETLRTDTIMKLTKAYVHANRAVESGEVEMKPTEIFENLEKGDSELLRTWKRIKEWSTHDLAAMYEKLNVEFDEYDWESNYSKNNVESHLERLLKKGILKDDEFGRKVVNIEGNDVCLLKSDGSTLYLLRDIAAFFERRARHKFDKIYYVVDGTQSQHFNHLAKICEELEENSSGLLEHVHIGRIVGMSTRAGTSVFLKDLLQEAQERMYQKQLTTRTTKMVPTEESAAQLGISGIVVNDLRHRRRADYKFDWDLALSMHGHSGVQIQYAHCRLCSLMENSGATLPNECDPSVLREPEAVGVILNIARFEEVVIGAEHRMEPQLVVDYLFDLMTSLNKAFAVLRVKGADPHIASQRLLMFNTGRVVIGECLRLLGITPMEKM